MTEQDYSKDPVWMNWGRLIGACAVTVFGVIGVVGLVPRVTGDISSRSWPESAMTVTQIVREQGGTKIPSVRALVDFEFTVNGQRYESKRHLLKSSVVPADLDPFLRDYAVGTRHPVYYNPGSPGTQPQIERGGNLATNVFGLVLCVMCVVFGPLAAWHDWVVISFQSRKGATGTKKKRKRPRSE